MQLGNLFFRIKNISIKEEEYIKEEDYRKGRKKRKRKKENKMEKSNNFGWMSVERLKMIFVSF